VQRRKVATGREEMKKGKGLEGGEGMGLERESNTTAFCFLLPCFGLFFYLPFLPFPFVLGFGFPCALAPLRLCVPFFLRSSLSYPPLPVRFNFYG
jgi:hypothetical protein